MATNENSTQPSYGVQSKHRNPFFLPLLTARARVEAGSVVYRLVERWRDETSGGG